MRDYIENVVTYVINERKRQGISQTKMAKLIGVGRRKYIRIESREIESISFNDLVNIMGVLGNEIMIVKKGYIIAI